MNDEERYLGELASHPGFLQLLALLDSELEMVEGEMEGESIGQELLKKTRYWQFTRRIRSVLATTPENLKAELENEKERELMETFNVAPTPQIEAYLRDMYRQRQQDEELEGNYQA